jgi:hypothetical protein
MGFLRDRMIEEMKARNFSSATQELECAPPTGDFSPRFEGSTIPIVMTNESDPVGNGLVASFSRPGGNITGLPTLSAEPQVLARAQQRFCLCMELAEGNFVLDNLAAALEFSRCFNHNPILLKLFIVSVKTSSHGFWTGRNRPIGVNRTNSGPSAIQLFGRFESKRCQTRQILCGTDLAL